MIQTRDLRVDYEDVTAVHDMTLEIPWGEVFGLIGPNGAGKTSTIRVLATLLQPTYGEVRVADIDVLDEPGAVRDRLGYMPDFPPVYDDLRCWEFLDLFAGAFSVNRNERKQRVDKCLDDVKLNEKRNAMAGTLSRGMKQRLVLAKTLLPEPKVLLLDEPASGLDPLARIEMRDLLRQLGAQGKTVLISSHILSEMSEFCTSIGIMERGRLVISGGIDDIIDELNTSKSIVIDLVGADGGLAARLGEIDDIHDVKTTDKGVVFGFHGSDEDVAELLRQLVHENVPMKAFYERRMGLEDILQQVGAKEVS